VSLHYVGPPFPEDGADLPDESEVEGHGVRCNSKSVTGVLDSPGKRCDGPAGTLEQKKMNLDSIWTDGLRQGKELAARSRERVGIDQ